MYSSLEAFLFPIFYFFLTLAIIYHVAVVLYWVMMKSKYGRFAEVMPAIQEILRDILQQSMNQGSVDINAVCAASFTLH